MLQNNVARKSWHNYQIVFDGKAWFAWYYVDLNEPIQAELQQILSTKEG